MKSFKERVTGGRVNINGLDWQDQPDRPQCFHCGLPARYHSKNKDGSVKSWRNSCTTCHKNRGQKRYCYRIHKKQYCEQCGFVAIHPTQLDVDHVDGNKNNERIENLRTLCANCHRLKTVLSGDHNGKKFVLTKELKWDIVNKQ